ncbi:hypothetical protein [Cytobacillus purgationiresistens]|uniref:Uncharacterized protein n=1 Tax=Cytobacillus purgationiresistens TaxID=863449 RepID=A0ABU0AH13_9BACI|nr:hypothetical protein [Cytobacillus purgationiresistens]MDQ0270549.1 hypothetical protein [Cytobacillus purgationiresistens]
MNVVTILISIIAVVIAIFLLSKRFKMTYSLLIIYIGALLISSIFIWFISIEDERERIKTDEMTNQFNETLRQGERERIDPLYLMKEETFQIDEDQELTLTSNYEWEVRVYVDRKNIDDGKVEASIYHIGPYVDGVYVTDSLAPYRLKKKEDTLGFYVPQDRTVKVTMGAPEFTVTQFKYGEVFSEDPIYANDPAIYLQVPKSLKIKRGEGVFIDYVK